MKPYFDIHGNEIKDGDTIKMPHVVEYGYAINEDGCYVTKVEYNQNRDCLIDDNGFGFRLAFGVEKVFE